MYKCDAKLCFVRYFGGWAFTCFCYVWTRLHFCAGHLAGLPVTKEIFIQFEGRVR